MRLRFSLVLALLVAAAAAVNANAGTVTLNLVLNPAAPGCGGCTLSGTGTWDLLASDSLADNSGIASYGISVQGVATVLHRSPRAGSVIDADTNDNPAGFTLLRSGNNATVKNAGFLIGASQDTIAPTPYLLTGFGQAAGTFTNKLPAGVTISSTTQPSWAANLLLAEGTFLAGTTPSIDLNDPSAFINLFSAGGTSAVEKATVVLGGGGGPNPPVVTPLSIINNTLNATVQGDLVASNTPTSYGPSPLVLASYTPGFGALAGAPGSSVVPSFSTTTGHFSWDTTGATRGTYVWNVSATNAGGTGNGTITVEQHAVPEPATLSLIGLAAIGLVGFARRRS